MKEETRKRKQFVKKFKEATGDGWLVGKMYQVMTDGKKAFDSFALEMGKLLAETIMEIEPATNRLRCRTEWHGLVDN